MARTRKQLKVLEGGKAKVSTTSRTGRVTSYVIDDEVMFDIRMRLHDWDAKDAAEEMDVSVACVYGIRNGRTKWPRPKTFFALLELLDLQLRLYDTKNQKYL